MEHKRIIPILICLLTLSSLVLGTILYSLDRRANYLPDESIEALVQVLKENDIEIDPEIISKKIDAGTVYLNEPEDYHATAASLLSDGKVKSTYKIPDGVIMTTDRGEMFSFGDNFSFDYHASGEHVDIPDFWDGTYLSGHLSETKYREISKIAADFLDRGSKVADTDSKISVVTLVDNIFEKNGIYYVICSRTIDGVEITDNTALCTVKDGRVVDASGTWCFISLGDSYSAQLSDILNILFNVKKEIVSTKETDKTVTILGVERCYSLYFLGNDEEFCLIPCLKIVTDSMGEYIYNAIDSTLYTKN